MRRLFALLLALAPAAQAETYKWVDERGVVNYSNTPPPSAARAAPQPVADRVSTYESDPAFRRVAAYSTPTPYEVMQQQEWLQRQQLMAAQQNLQTVYENPPVDPYPYYYRTGYYVPTTSVRATHQRRGNRNGGSVRVIHYRR